MSPSYQVNDLLFTVNELQARSCPPMGWLCPIAHCTGLVIKKTTNAFESKCVISLKQSYPSRETARGKYQSANFIFAKSRSVMFFLKACRKLLFQDFWLYKY